MFILTKASLVDDNKRQCSGESGKKCAYSEKFCLRLLILRKIADTDFFVRLSSVFTCPRFRVLLSFSRESFMKPSDDDITECKAENMDKISNQK